MLDNSQNILRLASAAAVLMIGASVAYHYVIYIPTKDEAARNYLLSKENTVREAADQKTERDEAAGKAREVAAQNRRTAYQVCVSNVLANYSARWDASCKRIARDNDRERQNCVTRGVAEPTCLDWYPVRATESCGLPTSVANDYDKSLDGEKDRCFRASSIEAVATQ